MRCRTDSLKYLTYEVWCLTPVHAHVQLGPATFSGPFTLEAVSHDRAHPLPDFLPNPTHSVSCNTCSSTTTNGSTMRDWSPDDKLAMPEYYDNSDQVFAYVQLHADPIYHVLICCRHPTILTHYTALVKFKRKSLLMRSSKSLQSLPHSSKPTK